MNKPDPPNATELHHFTPELILRLSIVQRLLENASYEIACAAQACGTHLDLMDQCKDAHARVNSLRSDILTINAKASTKL
jgi:hypothetical protein